MTEFPGIYSLDGKNVLVTGATGYLGQAMARGLASLGATVSVNGRNISRVNEIVAGIEERGFSAIPAAFDVTDELAVKEWFSRRGEVPLHGLVNNAYLGGGGSIETANEGEYRDSYEVALVASHRLLTLALPALRLAVNQCGDASVINIASMYGVVSPDQRIYPNKNGANPPFYGASKAALLQWTRYAACEFGNESIRVNAISPGPFPSKSVQASNPDFVTALAGRVPLGRIGQASEMQGPLAFLLSSASSFVNGNNLLVDGGWTCW